MKTGMTFTIEPAISEGSDQIYLMEDDWTAVTIDGSRSAQFEHTILITGSTFFIQTLKGSDITTTSGIGMQTAERQ